MCRCLDEGAPRCPAAFSRPNPALLRAHGELLALEGISGCGEQEIYESRGFLDREELAEVRKAEELCSMLFGKELMVRLARGRRVVEHVTGSPQERRPGSISG